MERTELTKTLQKRVQNGGDRESTNNADFDPNNIKTTVEEVKNFKDYSIGGFGTFIAFKNPTSYLIATSFKGFKLIENGTIICSSKLPRKAGWIQNVIYIEPLNCYWICFPSIIFRKDIDSEQFYPRFSGKGAIYRYSRLNQRLLIARVRRDVLSIDLKRERADFKAFVKHKGKFIDLVLFGKKENKVAYITSDGSIGFFVLNFMMKKFCVRSTLQLEEKELTGEMGRSLAVCSKNEYLFVETSSILLNHTMHVIRIDGRKLTKLAVFEEFCLGMKNALACCGYAGSKIIWVGLSELADEGGELYCFDLETNELTELEEKRFKHQEEYSSRLMPLGDHFYYTGNLGKVMRLSINLS